MSMASTLARAVYPRPTKKKGGRPGVYLDPDHIAKRAFALHKLRAGEPVKKVAKDLNVRRETLWRWFNGKLKDAPAS